jgi:CheY-like chemotaxis protein
MRQLFERYTSKHKAISAATLEEAARLVKNIQPSALVVDKSRAANIHDVAGSTPVITCSMPSGRRTMQLYGATDYLVKPVSRAELFTSLERLNLPVHTILLIDDDPDVVRMFSRMLQTAPQQYELWKAYGGMEGLAQMEQQPPDVVLLDVLMPEVDGFEVVRKMKANPALASVPIIMISAYGAMETIEASADGELAVVKPAGFQPIELVRCIEALVEEFRPATEPAR